MSDTRTLREALLVIACARGRVDAIQRRGHDPVVVLRLAEDLSFVADALASLDPEPLDIDELFGPDTRRPGEDPTAWAIRAARRDGARAVLLRLREPTP